MDSSTSGHALVQRYITPPSWANRFPRRTQRSGAPAVCASEETSLIKRR
jgi:hypothetical protein